MKPRSMWKDLGHALSFPFSPRGSGAFLTVIVLHLIPFLSPLGRAVAYDASAGPRTERGAWDRVGLAVRMLLAALLLAAPALFFLSLGWLLYARTALPPAVLLIPAVLAVYAAVRLVLLTPLSWAALTCGMPMKAAVSVKELKRAMEGCFWRYLIYTLLDLPLIWFMAMLSGLPEVTALPAAGAVFYLLRAVGAALVQMIMADLHLSAFRASYGIPSPSREQDAGAYRLTGPGRAASRAAAGALAAVMLLTSTALAAPYGEDVQPVRPQDGAVGQADYLPADPNAAAARERLERAGLWKPDSVLEYDSDTGRYYLRGQMKVDELRRAQAVLVVDIATDFIPYVNVIKHTAVAGYSAWQWVTAENRADRDSARSTLAIKTATLASMGLSKYVTYLKGLGDGVKDTFLVRTFGEKAFPALVDKSEKVGAFLDWSGYFDSTGEALRTAGIIDDETAGTYSTGGLINRILDNKGVALFEIDRRLQLDGSYASSSINVSGSKLLNGMTLNGWVTVDIRDGKADVSLDYTTVYDFSMLGATSHTEGAARWSQDGVALTESGGDYVADFSLTAPTTSKSTYSYSYDIPGYGSFGDGGSVPEQTVNCRYDVELIVEPPQDGYAPSVYVEIDCTPLVEEGIVTPMKLITRCYKR